MDRKIPTNHKQTENERPG